MLHLYFQANTQLKEISLPSFSPFHRWGAETGSVTSTGAPGKGSSTGVSAFTPYKGSPSALGEGCPSHYLLPETAEREQLPATRGPQAVGGLGHGPTAGSTASTSRRHPRALSEHRANTSAVGLESALKSGRHPGIPNNFI